MPLIKTVKQVKKAAINIQVSKDLADKYNAALDAFNKHNNANITLDFDTIAKKLTAELTKLNSAHEADGK